MIWNSRFDLRFEIKTIDYAVQAAGRQEGMKTLTIHILIIDTQQRHKGETEDLAVAMLLLLLIDRNANALIMK